MKKTQVRPASAVQPPSEPAANSSGDPAIPSLTPALPRHGSYSIERLLALEEYSRTTSLRQVLFSAIWTPMVPVIIVLIFQLPHLAPPEAGLLANWVYVIERGGIGAAIGSECTLRLVCSLMPELIPVLPLRTRLVVNTIIGLLYIVVSVTLSLTVGFPVPFTASIIDPISSVTWSILIQLIARPVLKDGSEAVKRRFQACFIYAGVISVMAIVYPAYMALFFTVGTRYPKYQPLVTLLVPMIKFVLRKITIYAVREWEDLTPVMVIFSVDFFSSLYQTMSVQASSSYLTTAVIIFVDFAFAARSQWKLYKSTTALQRLFHDTGTDSLLTEISSICDEPVTLQASSAKDRLALRSIRVHSTVQNGLLPPITRHRLELIDKAGDFSVSARFQSATLRSVGRVRASRLRSLLTRFGFVSERVVSTKTEHSSSAMDLNAAQTSGRTQGKPVTVVIEATRMLFRTETLLLTEYLECFIPLFYAVNLVFVWLSPNAAYYPSMEATHTAGGLGAVLLNIALLFALEVVSFVALIVVLWKRLRFSPLHQLGFVLEHQASLMRANMLFVFLLAFYFDLAHSGADFSFQFKWLHKQDVTG